MNEQARVKSHALERAHHVRSFLVEIEMIELSVIAAPFAFGRRAIEKNKKKQAERKICGFLGRQEDLDRGATELVIPIPKDKELSVSVGQDGRSLHIKSKDGKFEENYRYHSCFHSKQAPFL